MIFITHETKIPLNYTHDFLRPYIPIVFGHGFVDTEFGIVDFRHDNLLVVLKRFPHEADTTP